MHNRQSSYRSLCPCCRGHRGKGSYRVAGDTSRGRDAAVGVKNGTYRGLSVEFHSEREISQPMGCEESQKRTW